MIASPWDLLVNEALRKQNLKQWMYDYAQGQKVLKKVLDLMKLGFWTEGPYEIACVHNKWNDYYQSAW